MNFITRIRNKMTAKDDEIARLTKANDTLTEHNLKLAADSKSVTEENSRLRREQRKLEKAVKEFSDFADEVDPPTPAADVSAEAVEPVA